MNNWKTTSVYNLKIFNKIFNEISFTVKGKVSASNLAYL